MCLLEKITRNLKCVNFVSLIMAKFDNVRKILYCVIL